ncbi:MAG TPA: gluconeogenesis factor YvcK family protein, partial [Terriglobia bacterium]|nr:gluconeogenesis factor YvcK family protein [Terriglobia bacterium]
IGGGTGLAVLLRGLKQCVNPDASRGRQAVDQLTAVVTVTDEGGSSGRLRRDFGMLPPGDIRNCLVALAEDEKILTRLFNFRFAAGKGLRGHSLGNLFLTALTNLTGDFSMAVRLASEVLAVRGEIFPATLADVRLRAQLSDGRRVEGESRIHRTRVPISKLSIVPARCRPLPETLKAVAEADLITLGPGSLYTSLLPNLLVSRVAQQIARSRAVRVYIGNLMTQPGETRGYSAAEHLDAIIQHVGTNIFDFAVLNNRAFPSSMRRRYAAEQAEPVVNDLAKIRALGVSPVCVPLLQAEDGVARHDAERLSRALLQLARRSGTASGRRGKAPSRVAKRA